jgi:hypothetical protein
MDIHQPANDETMNYEELIADDRTEMVWLRIQRLTSESLCRKLIKERIPEIDDELLKAKASGLASAIRGALGFWGGEALDLNSKVLSRYYGLLQLTIAEQIVASPNLLLKEIEDFTKYGHGLFTLSDPENVFPTAFNIGLLNSGYFQKYLEFRGVELEENIFTKRPREWGKVDDAAKSKLVSLPELFSRVPELQTVVREYFDRPPLAFRVATSVLNATQRFTIGHHKSNESIYQLQRINSDYNPEVTSGVAIFRQDGDFSPEFLNSLGLPLSDIIEVAPPGQGWGTHFVGTLHHSLKTKWYEKLKPHHSAYCPRSLVAPLWNRVTDPLIINFLILYGLSIIVRYLPATWHRIDQGDLDHFRELLKHYFVIVDKVVPEMMYERITGKRLIVNRPF